MKIEYECECTSCKGTGIYVGMGEKGDVGVVCHSCKGTGCTAISVEYTPFRNRKPANVKRVHQCNPGIYIDASEKYGGMPYEEWARGKPFEVGMENREFTCPAWYYQSCNYDLKPNWEWCEYGSFSQCSHFDTKQKCWARFDKDLSNET